MRLKRIVSIIAAMVVLVCCTISLDNEVYAERNSIAKISKHMNNINNTLLALGYDESDKIYSSEYASYSDENDVGIVFLYEENHMIGEYIVKQDGNRTFECFIVDDSQALYDMVVSEDELSIYESEDDILLMSNDEIYEICGEKDNYISYDKTKKIRNVNKDIVELRDEENIECEVENLTPEIREFSKISKNSAVYLTSTAKTGYLSLVDNIQNATSQYTGKGLCWAASGASIINYIKGSSYNYDALSMYDYVRVRTSNSACGLPTYEKAMFEFQGLSYNYRVGKLPYNSVLYSLKNDSPIMWAFATSDNIGHAVVQCGVFHIGDYYGYMYMDPNVPSGYVINYLDYSLISSSDNNTIYYYAGGNNMYIRASRCYYNFAD